jgi:hypothetical protein
VGVVVGLRASEIQEAAQAWVEATCKEQGLPSKVTDDITIGDVAVLLATTAEEVNVSKSA